MAFRFDTDPTDSPNALSRLSAIGFSEDSVRSRLGLSDINDLRLRAAAIYRQERLSERDPPASAIDLFILQGRIPVAELDVLFDASTQEALARAGILETSEGFGRVSASLYPVGTDLIFSDHASYELDPSERAVPLHDRVMYVGSDSRWLARATMRKSVEAMLDLCCGSGIHALLAAAHAVQVTAVDINPRAVLCTAFNAKLKGLSNLKALEGDLYAPVEDRRFDLITANPPFVPAPVQKVGFRDGGPSGEEVQRRIIEGLPRHLAPGGTAQMVTEFGENDDDPLERRLRRWLGPAPIDIHVLRLRTNSAHAYALGHATGEDPTEFLASAGLWAANLKAHGYRRVVSVLLAFQWSKGAPWSRVDEARPPTKSAGAEVEAIFAAERLSGDAALKDRLRTNAVVRVGPVAIFESRVLGAAVATAIQARLFGQAMSVEHSLAPMEVNLLANMDHPVATTTVLALATKARLPEEAVLDSLVSLVRKGFIRPVP
jgi:methylase of polypeptide subunit release factors